MPSPVFHESWTDTCNRSDTQRSQTRYVLPGIGLSSLSAWCIRISSFPWWQTPTNTNVPRVETRAYQDFIKRSPLPSMSLLSVVHTKRSQTRFVAQESLETYHPWFPYQSEMTLHSFDSNWTSLPKYSLSEPQTLLGWNLMLFVVRICDVRDFGLPVDDKRC